MIHNKTKALFLGLGLLAGTAASIGLSAFAQTNPITVPSNASVQSVSPATNTNDTQDVNGKEAQDGAINSIDNETDDDKGEAKGVNEQKNDNEKPGTETEGSQEIND
jgi:hypothetical protein